MKLVKTVTITLKEARELEKLGFFLKLQSMNNDKDTYKVFVVEK